MDPLTDFEALYTATYADLLRFVQRRTDRHLAEDAVAEAYVVVWRRWADLPRDPGDARAWVHGVARQVLLNVQRGDRRRRALGVRLADARSVTDGDQDAAALRIDVARAWDRLTEVHQEALALSALDGLTAPQAGQVLGISPVAYRLRLSRARRALRAHLQLTAPTASERTTCDVS